LLRSLRQDLEKTRRHHDWDALKLAEHQPISIASYKTISASQSRDLQQLIVVGVATNLHGSSQFHLYCTQPQIRDDGPAPRFIHVFRELGPGQSRLQFIEQLARRNQRCVVEHPIETGEGFTVW
jgi:hypothetical protein